MSNQTIPYPKGISAFLLMVMLANPAFADRSWWEKSVPKAEGAKEGYIYIAYAFSKSGRYLTNHKKYISMSSTSRDRAISMAVLWQEQGLRVHMMWSKRNGLTKQEIDQWIDENYQKNYGSRDTKRPTANTPSIAGTVWLDQNLEYYLFHDNGRMERGENIKGLVSNDRGTWRQNGNKVTVIVEGYRQDWTIQGKKMTYGGNRLTRRK